MKKLTEWKHYNEAAIAFAAKFAHAAAPAGANGQRAEVADLAFDYADAMALEAFRRESRDQASFAKMFYVQPVPLIRNRCEPRPAHTLLWALLCDGHNPLTFPDAIALVEHLKPNEIANKCPCGADVAAIEAIRSEAIELLRGQYV